MKYRIEDTFDISAEGYWDFFFSDEYGAGLWPALDITWELLVLTREGEGSSLRIHREQRLTPQREVPGFLKRIVKGAITYVEKNDFVAADNVMHTVTIPGFAADRLRTEGTYRLVPQGSDRVLRVWEGICECKVPLVGGKIEKQLVEEVHESYRRATTFTRDFIAKRKG